MADCRAPFAASTLVDHAAVTRVVAAGVNQLIWETTSPAMDGTHIDAFEASAAGIIYLACTGVAESGGNRLLCNYSATVAAGRPWRVIDPLGSTITDPPPLLVPEAGTVIAPPVTITDVARIAGGVAEVTFSVPVTVVPDGFALTSNFDINGHSVLTFNAQTATNKVRVNTGGGTTVGTPWTLSGLLQWIEDIVGLGSGLIT